MLVCITGASQTGFAQNEEGPNDDVVTMQDDINNGLDEHHGGENPTREAIKNAEEEVKENLTNAAEYVKEKAEDAVDYTKEKAEQVKDYVVDKVDDIKE